jgi:hypothetical protein
VIWEETMAKDLSTEQWNQLLSVLSLDNARGFYDAMGVPVENTESFQASLREAIMEGRQRYETNPRETPDVAKLLLQRLDATTAQRFVKWASGAFLGYHADQPDWSAWEIVFSRWAYSRQNDLAFLPQQKRESLVSEYRLHVTTDDIERLATEALEASLSDWDLEMYARRDWGASWESSPFSVIESIVRIERLKRFARAFRASLDEREREAMQRAAEKLVEELGVWMPGPLPTLDSLLGLQ